MRADLAGGRSAGDPARRFRVAVLVFGISLISASSYSERQHMDGSQLEPTHKIVEQNGRLLFDVATRLVENQPFDVLSSGVVPAKRAAFRACLRSIK